MLIPCRTRWRHQYHPGRSGYAERGTGIALDEFGIQAPEGVYPTSRQIEAARITMTRHVECSGKIRINIFPDRPLTKRPAKTRMGSGKDSAEWRVAPVKPSRILLETGGVSEELARKVLPHVQYKLSIKTHFVAREGGG